MASKKRLIASTPAVPNNPSTFQGIVDTSAPSSIESSTFAMRTAFSDESSSNTNSVPTKQTTLELLFKAIEVVGVPRKGASYVAILRWITNNKENVVIGQFRAILKKTVLKALDTGLLKRANVSKNSIGLRGYFLMNKESLKKDVKTKEKKKAASKKKDNNEPNESDSASDAEVTKKPRKKNVERLNNAETEVVGRKKVLSNATSKQDGVKKAPSKVEKVKTATASKGKAKAETGPKTAAVSVPKKKAATASLKIAKAAKALMDETVILPRKEGVINDKKAAKTSGPKAKAASKTTTAPTSKPKTKAGNVEENIQDAETALKPKKGKAKTKPGKVQINQDEPEMTEVKMVGGKALKAPLKTQKKVEIKDPTTKKKLNPSRMNPVTNMSRKDLSDTELSVRPDNRKSLKSYSSDTEIEVFKKKKTTKKTKNRSDPADTKQFC